jgi:hypothetical protein
VSDVREIVVNTFVSLDGVMQAPGGPQEDPRDGFEYGGWIVGYWDEEASEAMRATMAPPFDHVSVPYFTKPVPSSPSRSQD